jgi:hypothetical protein
MAITLISPYTAKANTYRGQLHCHSNVNGGTLTPAQLVTAYKNAGYDFICLSDHDALTSDPGVGGILFIPSVEETCTTPSCHIGTVGVTSQKGADSQTCVTQSLAEGGFVRINHPYLVVIKSSLSLILGYHAVEVYNWVVDLDGADESWWWDQLLSLGWIKWGTASDDCHGDPTNNTYGWVMVYGDTLTQAEIVANLKAGNFYSSRNGGHMGISVNGLTITVTAEEAATISFIGKNGTVYKSEAGVLSSSYTVIGNEKYIRTKVEVTSTKYAFSNPIVVNNPDLIENEVYPMSVPYIQNYPALHIPLGCYNTNMTTALDGSLCGAYSFIGPHNPFAGAIGISEVRVYFESPVGSPQVTPYIYSDNNGVPGTVIANGTGVQSDAIAANGLLSLVWAGTLPVPTEGVQYWVVFKKTAGTSVNLKYTANNASNTYLTGAGAIGSYSTGAGLSWRNVVMSGLDGAWAGSKRQGVTGFRLKFTDGSQVAYMGYLLHTSSAVSGLGWRSDGTNEFGFKITTLDSVRMRVKSVAFNFTKNGTPGNLSVKAYAQDSIVPFATSNAIPVGNAGSNTLIFDFSTPIVLDPNRTYRFTLSVATGDGTNNISYTVQTLDTDANSLPLVPMPPWACYLSGGVWTDYSNTGRMLASALILDSYRPFEGGGLLTNSGLSGGLR